MSNWNCTFINLFNLYVLSERALSFELSFSNFSIILQKQRSTFWLRTTNQLKNLQEPCYLIILNQLIKSGSLYWLNSNPNNALGYIGVLCNKINLNIKIKMWEQRGFPKKWTPAYFWQGDMHKEKRKRKKRSLLH